jgi:hypothetical protein
MGLGLLGYLEYVVRGQLLISGSEPRLESDRLRFVLADVRLTVFRGHLRIFEDSVARRIWATRRRTNGFSWRGDIRYEHLSSSTTYLDK